MTDPPSEMGADFNVGVLSQGHYLGIVYMEDINTHTFYKRKSYKIVNIFNLFQNKKHIRGIYLGSTPVTRTISLRKTAYLGGFPAFFVRFLQF